MGDHEGWMQPSGLVPNGLLPNEAANVTRVLDVERWAKAEERTEELIKLIQPNKPSEKRRDAVANYVRRLIRQCFSCEVFTFGSVPLKTYLPDGDIDLTAFTMNENLKDTWALEVRDMLEKEEKSENAEFRVKEVQYIQAEVKIVKCLVENIVVDISFNQVGGLCTLCFLEEIDHLINQEYLFKRSIILIKAWCYYESRILGAHHGLISTYALETLVLYIFHVFNNSFSGPLEVLYRFLEFFSNFDWENFCVSLWGPVPISSLPDTTAQPPRKDGGELLLSQLFLGACSTVYAVMQPGQENQSQAFISKHFNVIDPLRTNNNLGRSVSKGNFFRIRSAFAFGAKRLARLLECPEEDLINELNQFFMNTWERHGSGNRPDAPSSDLCVARPLKTTAVEGANNFKTTINKKKSDNPGLRMSLEHQAESGLTFQGSATPISNNLSQHSRNMYKTATQAAITHPNSQKHYGNHINNRGSDQFERNNNSISSIRSDKNQKYLRSDHYVDDEEVQGRFQFARTQSSPELSEASAAVGFQGKHNKLIETNKELASSARVELATRRKNYSPEASGVHSSVTSFDDPTLLGRISSRQWFQPTAELNHVPNIPHEDAGLVKIGDLDSLSEKLEMQQEMNQEEQDLINMMTSSGVHNFGGQVQFPLQLASSHVHFPLSPVLASIGYAQRSTPGIFPANVPLVEPSWGSNLQFSQGHVSLPLSHYAPTVGGFPNADDFIDSVNENSGMIKGNLEGNGDPFWHEHDAKSSRPFSHGNGGINMCDDDESQQSTSGRSSVVSLSLADNYSTSLVHGQHRFSREDGELAREDYADGIQYPLSRVNDIYSTERTTSLRHSPISQSGSVITRLASESSKDGPGMKVSKSGRDKWGRKPASSAGMTSSYGKQKSSWHSRGPYNVSAEEDDDHRDWLRPSSEGDDIADRATTELVSPVTPHSSAHQSHGYESASVSGSDSMIPIGQVVIGGSRQGSTDHPAVVPLTFFPTGPPVPFLTMLPVYNFQHNSGTSDGSTSQFDRDDGEDHGHINPSDQDLDSPSDVDRSGVHMLAASKASAVEPSEEHKSDILNSDFASHWQNLQYGRSCQSTHLHGPLVYPPVMVPPVYLQGHFPLEAPGRPHSTNANLFTQIMSYGPRLVPLTPLQRGPLRPSVFNRFGDAPPRFRGGTGTYLPNHKASFRDRQPSNARNHRGSFNHDRSDVRDREGSWVNSKRAASRNHGRYQAERLSSRLDPLSLTENRTDRSVDSFRSEPDALCESQNTTFQSRSTSQSFANLPNSVYALPSASSNGVGPTMPGVHSVVMLYPYDQGASYVSPPESLEFGSLGPVQLSALSERTQPSSANSVRGVNEQKHSMHRGGSPRSSTDNPSSSLVQRSVDERKYDLKAEDFPPLSFPNQGGGGGGNNYKRKPSHLSFLSSPHS